MGCAGGFVGSTGTAVVHHRHHHMRLDRWRLVDHGPSAADVVVVVDDAHLHLVLVRHCTERGRNWFFCPNSSDMIDRWEV